MKSSRDELSPEPKSIDLARDRCAVTHTEAGVDIARFVGLNPSAVICEIMRDDGMKARLDELMPFAEAHGLKIGTIRDLIAFRLKNDNSIEQTAEVEFESRWGGTWTAKTFLNRADGSEQIALIKGSLDPSEPTKVRMHQLDICSDAFGETGSRGVLLQSAMKVIAEVGRGVIVAINKSTPTPLGEALMVRAGSAGKDMDAPRDYGLGAQILAALGVHRMIFLTRRRTASLQYYGRSYGRCMTVISA